MDEWWTCEVLPGVSPWIIVAGQWTKKNVPFNSPLYIVGAEVGSSKRSRTTTFSSRLNAFDESKWSRGEVFESVERYQCSM